jgi:hypothetical protein
LASTTAILGELFLHGFIERFLYKRRDGNEHPLLPRYSIIGDRATGL